MKLDTEDYCVVCGSPIPEGQMVCYACLEKNGLEQPHQTDMSCAKDMRELLSALTKEITRLCGKK